MRCILESRKEYNDTQRAGTFTRGFFVGVGRETRSRARVRSVRTAAEVPRRRDCVSDPVDEIYRR